MSGAAPHRARPPRLVGPVLRAALAALAGCGGLPEPATPTRVESWLPQGGEVALDAAVSVRFSAPVDPVGLVDGRRAALALAADARSVAAAASSEAGLPAGAPVVPCAAALLEGGRLLELRPLAPLAAGVSHAVVVGTAARDAAGLPILDVDGRRRAFVGTFATAPPPPGPPPRPAISEVRARAASPQAAGEYVEVANLGEGALDLTGWRLEKRTASGALAGCTVAPGGGAIASGAYGLVTGGDWDGRYAVPAGVARFTCGASALDGGLADDRPPDLRLVDTAGAVLATFGAAGAPACPAAIERSDLAAPDDPADMACAPGEGSPGACNGAAAACP